MRLKGFIGPSYTAQSVNVDCQRCINLYPEMDDLGTGKEGEVASLVSTPGLKLAVTLPTSPVRGVWVSSDGTLFAVAGTALYKVASDWTYTSLGSLVTSTGAVGISDNGIQLVIVDGLHGYFVTLATSAFTQIADGNFLGANQVVFQDGYFIFNKPGTGTFYLSPLNAITPFDALQQGTAEALPDPLVGILDTNENLFLFGSQSTEVYYDSGDVFPFARIQGAAVNVGCSATFSIAKIQGVPYWLGGDDTGSGIVYRMGNGYRPERISTSAIESQIRAAGSDNIAGARAWTYQQSGHLFYVLNVPSLKSTWVFDSTSNLWHERTWLNLWSQERHRADCHAVAYGFNVVGDYGNGNLYKLDPSTFNDNGTPIVRTRAAPHLSNGLVRLFYSSFQLDMETGVGLDGLGQGTDPVVILDWSDDGGHTWSNEHQLSIGKIGATKARAIARRLGASRDRVFRVRISDPVKVTLIGAEIGVAAGVA